MDAATRQLVRARAGERCEYCRLPQCADEATFHIEHVVARQHQGGDEFDNLALACDRCNLHKGTNLSAIDPQSSAIVLLFHPRRDRWEEHFEQHGVDIVGKMATGRATVRLLQLNSANRRRLRALLRAIGQW